MSGSVSIIIKALNEEAHIAAAIESALASLGSREGEVVLADSGSTDRTVEIACRYPIRVVQLANPHERSCGAGPQLGYQASRGDFVCLIDGDMVLDPGFLAEAVAFLDNNPHYAGVSGALRDVNLQSLEFVRRNTRVSPELAAGDADRLNGGGLFRRTAIDSVGYFTDRNLHSYEEADLGARLASAGWRLHRLERPFVDHYGHTTAAYALLWRRLTTRYAFGIGEIVRGAIGRPHLPRVLTGLRELRLWCAVLAAWSLVPLAALLFGATAALAVLAAVILAPIAAMSLRYKSLSLGTYAATGWIVHALGLVGGLMRPRVDPMQPIARRTLHDRTAERRADKPGEPAATSLRRA